MKQRNVLHPQLAEVIAAAGHGDVILVADAGLRVPTGARRIDLGVTCGVPTMAQTVRAIASELVVEAATVATEFAVWNPQVRQAVLAEIDVEPDEKPHIELMADMAANAYVYVKTGECTAYSSVALVCGVNYMQEALDLYAELHPEG